MLNVASEGAGPVDYFVSAHLTPASARDAQITTRSQKHYNLANNSAFTMIAAGGTSDSTQRRPRVTRPGNGPTQLPVVISVTVGLWTKTSAAACVLGCYG